MTSPDRQTVLDWLAESPNRTAEDAVDRWWPTHPNRKAQLTLVRSWKSRAAKAAREPQKKERHSDDEQPERVNVEEHHAEPGRMSRVEFLEWQLQRAVAVHDAAMGSGNVGRIIQADARLSEVRQHLDTARGEAGMAVGVERSPAAVAADLQKRDRRIAELAAAHERSVARERNL